MQSGLDNTVKPAAEDDISGTAGGVGLLGAPVGLVLQGVSKVHRAGEVPVAALRDVDLRIVPGEFVAVVGPSGSGKSTLLSLMGGLDRPTRGRVLADGVSLHDASDRTLADYRLRRVGTVFQGFNLVPGHDVTGNVALPQTLAGVSRAARRRRVGHLLELVGLRDRAGFPITRLSGGEQQRVAVARAIANGPGLILADEPTGNLDSEAGARVLHLLRTLHGRGATVVLVTHDPALAAQADRVIRVSDGTVRGDPPPQGDRALPAPPATAARRRLRWSDTLRLALGGLARRKLRTSLSMLGVTIGITALALILALATGIQSTLVGGLEQAGQLRQVTVQRDLSDPVGSRPVDSAALDTLRRLPHVTAAYGLVGLEGRARAGAASASSVTVTSAPPLSLVPPILRRALVAGAWPSTDSSPEALVNADLAGRLGWSPAQAIGRRLTFTAVYDGFLVTGAAAQPARVAVPIDVTVSGVIGSALSGTGPALQLTYETATRYWADLARANAWTGDEFLSITLVADSSSTTAVLAREVRAHGFGAQTAQDSIDQFRQLLLYLVLGLGSFAAIALVVACLGIANTMYTAVLERTREIGILKAVGARNAEVRRLFTLEAAVIGAGAGLLAVAVSTGAGLVGNQVINGVASSQGLGLSVSVFQMTPAVALAAVALAGSATALSGLLPAWRAGRLSPSETLRYG